MHIDLQQLRVFISVAREGGLTRASEKLHMSQPAVSLHLKNLQESLGLPLFKRSSYGVSLLPAGIALLPYAYKCLEALQEFKVKAKDLSSDTSGTLTLAWIISTEFSRLGRLSCKLMNKYPNLRLSMSHKQSGDILNLIKSRAIDVAFYAGKLEDVSDKNGIYAEHLQSIKYRVIAPPVWFDNVNDLSWIDLINFPWVSYISGSTTTNKLIEKFKQLDAKPNIVSEVDQESVIIDLVNSGMGLSIVRDNVAEEAKKMFGTIVVNNLSIDTDLFFIALKERKDDNRINAIFTEVIDLFKDDVEF